MSRYGTKLPDTPDIFPSSEAVFDGEAIITIVLLLASGLYEGSITDQLEGYCILIHEGWLSYVNQLLVLVLVFDADGDGDGDEENKDCPMADWTVALLLLRNNSENMNKITIIIT